MIYESFTVEREKVDFMSSRNCCNSFNLFSQRDGVGGILIDNELILNACRA